MRSPSSLPAPFGRYVLGPQLGSGKTAAVYLGLAREPDDERVVVVKRLHRPGDAKAVTRLLDEAFITERIAHPNVVRVRDVVFCDGEVGLLMDYIHGESLADLIRESSLRRRPIPTDVVTRIAIDALGGLHASHVATDSNGTPLRIVHRDVSPHNILVGEDGATRLLDFGISHASRRIQTTTRDGLLRGTIAYMAPEQFLGASSIQSDIYAFGVVLWELLTQARLFVAEGGDADLVQMVAEPQIEPPSKLAPNVPKAIEEIVMRALALEPDARFESALEMATALEATGLSAPPAAVRSWVTSLAGDRLQERSRLIEELRAQTEALATRAVGHGHKTTAARTSRRWLPMVLGLAAFTGLAGVGVALSTRSPPRVDATPQPNPPTEEARVAPLAALAPPPLPVRAPAPAQARAPEPNVSTTAPARRAVIRNQRVVGSETRKPARESCAPPFTIDSAGHRIPRLECM